MPLGLVHFGTFAVSQGSIYFQQYRMAHPKHDDMTTVLSVGVVGIFIFLVLSLLWIIWSAQIAFEFKNKLQPSNKQNISEKIIFKFDFQQTGIEYLRSIVSSLCYSLLFIIPGVVRFIQLSFTPFISLFDSDYDRGQVDALKKSKELLSGHFWMILLLFGLKLALSLTIESVLTLHGTLIDENPFGVSFNQVIQLIINLIFSVYMTFLFFEIFKSRSQPQ